MRPSREDTLAAVRRALRPAEQDRDDAAPRPHPRPRERTALHNLSDAVRSLERALEAVERGPLGTALRRITPPFDAR
jgi:hypothetical protein